MSHWEKMEEVLVVVTRVMNGHLGVILMHALLNKSLATIIQKGSVLWEHVNT